MEWGMGGDSRGRGYKVVYCEGVCEVDFVFNAHTAAELAPPVAPLNCLDLERVRLVSPRRRVRYRFLFRALHFVLLPRKMVQTKAQEDLFGFLCHFSMVQFYHRWFDISMTTF